MAICLTKYYLKIAQTDEARIWLHLLLESAKYSAIGKKYLLEAKALEIELHSQLGNFDLVESKTVNLKKVTKQLKGVI